MSLLRSIPLIVFPATTGGYLLNNFEFLSSKDSPFPEEKSEFLTISKPIPSNFPNPSPRVSVSSRNVTPNLPTPVQSKAGTRSAGYQWKVEGIQGWVDSRGGDGVCNVYEVKEQNDNGITFTFRGYTKRDRDFLRKNGILNRVACDTNRHFYVYDVFGWRIKQSKNGPSANNI